MESRATCPACHTRVMLPSGATPTCPACGARLKRKSNPPRLEVADDQPARKKKKKRKKARSGPNYPLIAGVGGGVIVLGAVIWIVVLGVQDFRRPGPAKPVESAGASGQVPVVAAGPTWTAKVDPPKGVVRPKDDLSIPIVGEPLFASGRSPFIADLVPVRVGLDNPPVISVYDLRTGERTATAKAIEYAQAPKAPGGSFIVALGPEGKTLAARVRTTTGKGRQASTTSEAVVYRLGQEAPVARLPVPNELSWMEFGRDDDQLIVVSASAATGFSAAAHDLKKKDVTTLNLEIPRTPIRWRNGFGRDDALAVSPGRNYLAVGEGHSVDLIQLSDGKLAGRCALPGDCLSVAFSEDGKELTVFSHTAPQRGDRMTPTQYQWTTFALADGKQLAQEQVAGGAFAGVLLAAGPNPGEVVHGDPARTVVTDIRIGAPAYSMPFHAVQCFDKDRLLGYDAKDKRVAVRRIDAEQLAAGEKELAEVFGPRPEPEKVDRSALISPSAPKAWEVPIDAAPDNAPALVATYTVKDGADFVVPWAGGSAMSAVIVRRVDTPRGRYSLQWQRVDMTTGKGDEPVPLWPSILPPGQVPPPAGSGSIVADQTFDGSRLALRDAANAGRTDIWDKSGKRLHGFLPYGKDGSLDGLFWAGDSRLITIGGGKVTGWEIPGPKAVFELTGYGGAYAVSPGRKWIALQYDKQIDLFETATGKPLGRLSQANPAGKPWHGFAVSPDGTQLAAVELVRPGYNEKPGIWGYSIWDLRTGQAQRTDRLFAGSGARPGHHVMWLAPRLLLAGGADVIDLDARAVTATLGLNATRPLASPDGRYWGARSDRTPANPDQQLPMETVVAASLDDTVRTLPRPAFADVVFREGQTVEVVSETGDGSRDAVIRSHVGQLLGAEGYGVGRGGWRIRVTGKRGGSSGTLSTPKGDKISIPSVSWTIQLVDPAGTVHWEGSASGGFDLNHSKYRTGKEELGPGPFGGSVTHFNFGARDPVEAMSEEAWDNFLDGLKSLSYPRVLARVNGKVVRLPIALPVTAGK
jgi:hypothetical protein